MTNRLSGKVCIITGTGGSMGRAAAEMFAAEGAKVVGCDVHAESAEATLNAVQSVGGTMVSFHPCDLTKEADCRTLVEFAIENYGRLDVVYNNAAMAFFGWIDEITVQDWYRTIDNELNIVFLLCRAAWPHLVANGGGSIINTASTSAKLAYKVLPGIAHSAAKGGVLALTRQLAMEGGPHLIRANTISPGLTETNQTRPLLQDPAWWGVMKDKLMLARIGQPQDIAPAAVFLASDESSWITGADIPVDGGTTAW